MRYGGPRTSPVDVVPGHVLPGVAPVQLLVGATTDTAVAVVGVAVYPTGAEVLLEVRLRHGSGPGQVPTLPPGWVREAHMIVPFAVRFSDGRAGTSVSWPGQFAWPAPGEGGVTLVPSGWETSEQAYGLRALVRYWLTPLPPPGPLTLLAAFPARGLDISEAVVDSAVLREAAGRAVALWDDGPALPRPGVPPDDVDGAVEQIRAAFGAAFTGGQGGSDPQAQAAATSAALAAVEGGEALRPLLEQVRAMHPAAVRSARPSIDEIVFLDPEHAAIRFRVELRNAPDFGMQIGYAVVERSEAEGEAGRDGAEERREAGAVWKVAGRTYRQVMRLGGAFLV